MQERVIDVMLFLLAQTDCPTYDDWYQAVDDMFGEFDEDEKHRMVQAGISLLERQLNLAPVRQLRAA
jgi:hypothetical protein